MMGSELMQIIAEPKGGLVRQLCHSPSRSFLLSLSLSLSVILQGLERVLKQKNLKSPFLLNDENAKSLVPKS